MPTVPSTLGLDLSIGPQIAAAEHNNNYAAIQTAVNAIIEILNGGAINDVLTVGGSGPDWSALTPSAVVPTGAVVPYGGAAAPTGWLLCDGAAVSRTTYSTLFGVLSTTYGVGDGSTTFNVPDLRGRVTVGKGSNASVDTLGENEGVAEANRRPHHNHTATTDAENITGTINLGSSGGGNPAGSWVTGTVTVGPAGTNPVETPAYIVLNAIIKT